MRRLLMKVRPPDFLLWPRFEVSTRTQQCFGDGLLNNRDRRLGAQRSFSRIVPPASDCVLLPGQKHLRHYIAIRS